MDREAARTGDVAQGRGLLRAQAGAALAVVRVLAANLLRLKTTVRRVQRSELKPAHDRCARNLVLEDMAIDLEDHLLPRLRMAEERAKVSHRPARDEERRRLANHLRGALLQTVDGGVFVPDVVADLGRRHRRPHRRGRQGERVTAQLDNSVHCGHPMKNGYFPSWA